MNKLQLINKEERDIKNPKIEIIVYQSVINRARDFLKKLGHKQDDPIIRAKRILYILEAIKRH
jgi:hypothetical protein